MLGYQFNNTFPEKKKRFEHPSTAAANKFTQADELCSPFTYFSRFFDEDLFHHIVENTNLYSFQQTGVSIRATVDEMKTYIGIRLLMGIMSQL